VFRSLLRLTLAVLAVSLILAAPLHGAASRGSATGPASRTSPASLHLPGFWDWVTGIWAKAGCCIDPGGLCSPCANPPGPPVDPPAASNADEGCGLDPGGRTCAGHS
jgi:hypothetical protein